MTIKIINKLHVNIQNVNSHENWLKLVPAGQTLTHFFHEKKKKNKIPISPDIFNTDMQTQLRMSDS